MIMANKLRRVRCGRYLACMGEMRNTYRNLVGKREGKSHLGEQDIDGNTMLKWI
jgi:hypothetical protein